MKQLTITIGAILFSVYLYGQGGVGINNSGNAPNTSAMLDVSSTDKGLLIPRIALTSTTDITTITNGNVTSLLVYNSATIADVVPGYYYWDGTVWKTIGGNDADADPTNEIQDLQLVGNNLTITNNGTPTTIDLSNYLDNTDDQNIDSVTLNGSNLTVYIEDGTSSAVDLSSLSDHDWYEVGGTTAPDNITDDIFTQGNVGIGTASPIERLHVEGGVRIDNGGGTDAWRLVPNGDGTFAVKEAGFTDMLTMEPSGASGQGTMTLTQGNVGIGLNTAPLEKLHVNGEVRNNGLVMFGTNNAYKGVTDASHIYGSSATGGGYPFNGGGNLILQSRRFGTRDILFVTGANATPRMVIKGTGFIGIETVTPTNKLQVGSIGTTGYGGNQIAIGNGTDAMAINSNAGRTLFTSNTSFDFVGSGDFLIYGNNVGIGTTTPTNKLDINGDLRIQTIAQGTGADVALVADANGLVKQVAPYVPPGAVIPFAMATAPAGWLICDGSAVSRTTYAGLFASIGTTYGVGNNTTTFNLPDLRGEFIRGWDNGRGIDNGRTNGSSQKGTASVYDYASAQTFGLFKPAITSGDDFGADPYIAADYPGVVIAAASAANTYAPGGNNPDVFGVVRPRNVAMNYCIRF